MELISNRMDWVYKRIKEERKRKRISQSVMAKKLNISHTAYGKLENGQTKLSISRFFEICQLLELNVFSILREKYKDQAYDNVVSQIELYKSAIDQLSMIHGMAKNHVENLKAIWENNNEDGLSKQQIKNIKKEVENIEDMLYILNKLIEYFIKNI